jgi:hypothetical protein
MSGDVAQFILADAEWLEALAGVHEAIRTGDHRRLLRSDEGFTSPFTLRFRREELLRSSLTSSGFSVENVFGDWERRRSAPGERELIVVAKRS